MSSTSTDKNVSSDGALEAVFEGGGTDGVECRNCQTELAGNFCHHCGQRAEVQRLSLVSLCKDAVRRALDLDSVYVRTLIGMIRHPGHLVSAYVSGERKPCANPFKFLILTITLTTLLRWGAAEAGLWRLIEPESTEVTVLENNRWIFYSLQELLLGSSLVLLFWRSGRNLAENMAFGLFVGGPIFFYMSIAEFIGFHAFGAANTIWDQLLIFSAFVAYLVYAGAGFYAQRVLYIVPKMLVAAVLSLLGVAGILASLPLG